jgi:5-methylcytosine-specific restriction enzyme A
VTERRRFCPKGHDTFEVGRDSSYRCLVCKREQAIASRTRRNEEAAAAAHAERERERAEADLRRQREQERQYQRAIKAGGHMAAEAKWWRASDSGDLCQWEDEIEGEYTHVCYRRTASVYCWRHSRQLQRETEQRRRERAAEVRRWQRRACVCGIINCTRHGGRSGWAIRPSKGNHYVYGSGWQRVRLLVLKRDAYVCQLRYPGCTGRAGEVDHIVQPEFGGTADPTNLRAVCKRCHATRTAKQGHEAAKRRRKEPRCHQ